MAAVHYITCPKCLKRYYLDRLLYNIAKKNPEQKLKCPFCKTEFTMPTAGKQKD